MVGWSRTHCWTWERHPGGDELVHILRGRARLELRTDAGTEDYELSSGMILVVPRGLWHRFYVNGALVEPGDWKALATVLERVARKPETIDAWRRELPAARTMDAIAADYERLYLEVSQASP